MPVPVVAGHPQLAVLPLVMQEERPTESKHCTNDKVVSLFVICLIQHSSGIYFHVNMELK